jgi:hypothetical protein
MLERAAREAIVVSSSYTFSHGFTPTESRALLGTVSGQAPSGGIRARLTRSNTTTSAITPVILRALTAADEDAVTAFTASLPADGRPLRYFSGAHDERLAAFWADPAQGTDHYGLIAESTAGRIIAHAAYLRLYGPRAEIALDLEASAERVALAIVLISDLARVANDNGIRHFVAAGPPGSEDILDAFVDGSTSTSRVGDLQVVNFPIAVVLARAEATRITTNERR